MENLISNFYILQAILERGDVPENKRKIYVTMIQNIDSLLRQNGFLIKEVEKKESKTINDPIARINTDVLISSFKYLVEKDGKIIEPNYKLLSTHYEFLKDMLVSNQ